MKKIKYARFFSLMLAAVCLFSAASCSSEKFASTEEEKAVVMTVGAFGVPMEIYRYFAVNYRSDYEKSNPDASNMEIIEYVKKYTEASLLRCYAVLTLAAQHGLSLGDQHIKDSVELDVKYYIEEAGGDDEYIAQLAAAGMNDSVLRFVLGEQTLEEQLYYKLINNKTIDDDESVIRAAINGDDFVRVKQILIKNDKGDDRAANLALANEACRRAKAGESFDALMAEYSEDTIMIGNTDGYYFTRGEMIEDFEEACFALPVGGISDVVETEVGYSVILRLEKDDKYIAANYEKLRESYLTAKYNAMIDEITNTLTVEYKTDTTDVIIPETAAVD